MQLDGDTVDQIFNECLFRDGEPTEPHVEAEGIMAKVGFHPDRLQERATKIEELLRELPNEFRSASLGGGGGWTFLNACNDRHGNQWTGLHQRMDQLFMLGLALEKVAYCLPRPMWSALPGGMPYVEVLV